MKLSTIILSGMMTGLAACSSPSEMNISEKNRYDFANLLDISLTPQEYKMHRVGCFTDAGSWMGFTIPEKEKWINGFCGPFSIDNRVWFAQSAVKVSVNGAGVMKPDSLAYFPGEVYMSSSCDKGSVVQRMNFIDSTTALLMIKTDASDDIILSGEGWNKDVELSTDGNNIVAKHPFGEVVTLTFEPEVKVSCVDGNYLATMEKGCKQTCVAISFFTGEKDMNNVGSRIMEMLDKPESAVAANLERWNGYLDKVLRDDMKPEYDRIAVKSVMTLLSNWRSHREGLLHDGVIPSHAVHYFVGFWAWDSWRFSAAMSRFAPELAKNNIRAMFDYQQPDGMIIDCIYTDPAENNARDSKPPLVCWAVDEILTHTGDTAFVKEMYPQLLRYYKWWFQKRDHDGNGICEFGSTDGTLEAAAWESGMDNAIRFDDTKMVKNASDAWSMDQESVDLNAYLVKECSLLKKFAEITGSVFDGPEISAERVSEYFFDEESGWFCDRKLGSSEFIKSWSCEGYTPFWTEVATKEQMDKALNLMADTNKFSTYIPFPTAAADNPKCDTNGYWRGPIWLDQTYFAIRGLRNYGYGEIADKYTEQVFQRCKGLISDSPIHENYATHTGELLKAPHFSWSAAHLLMMYEDFGK